MLSAYPVSLSGLTLYWEIENHFVEDTNKTLRQSGFWAISNISANKVDPPPRPSHWRHPSNLSTWGASPRVSPRERVCAVWDIAGDIAAWDCSCQCGPWLLWTHWLTQPSKELLLCATAWTGWRPENSLNPPSFQRITGGHNASLPQQFNKKIVHVRSREACGVKSLHIWGSKCKFTAQVWNGFISCVLR